jgi:hypothetical protein
MPSAEEWSAFFGASTLVALAFAWYQIRQVDQSNKALIASNDLSRMVNMEAVRPRVQVFLEPSRTVLKSRGAPVQGTIYIAVKNIGASPATNVRLSVDRPFASLDKFFKPGMMGAHFDEVNAVFNGEVHFRTLHPGSTYIWFLGQAPALFDDNSGIPRRWEVNATYESAATSSPFADKHILDLDIEKRIELPVDPLIRIGRDIEVVADQLGSLKKAIPQRLDLSDRALLALKPARKTRMPRLIRNGSRGRGML